MASFFPKKAIKKSNATHSSSSTSYIRSNPLAPPTLIRSDSTGSDATSPSNIPDVPTYIEGPAWWIVGSIKESVSPNIAEIESSAKKRTNFSLVIRPEGINKEAIQKISTYEHEEVEKHLFYRPFNQTLSNKVVQLVKHSDKTNETFVKIRLNPLILLDKNSLDTLKNSYSNTEYLWLIVPEGLYDFQPDKTSNKMSDLTPADRLIGITFSACICIDRAVSKLV